MAWNTPTSWTSLAAMTKARLDAQIYDNMVVLGGHAHTGAAGDGAALTAAAFTNRTRYIWVPIQNGILAAGTPAYARVGSAAEYAKANAWAFDGSAVESVGFDFIVLPADMIATGTFTPTLYWAPVNNNAGNVEWGFEYAWIDNNDQIDEAAVALSDVITACGGIDIVHTTTFAASAAKASGDILLRILVHRRGDLGGDTYNALDAHLVAIKLEYDADS